MCSVVEKVMKYSLIDASITDGGNNFEVRATLHDIIHGFSLGRSDFSVVTDCVDCRAYGSMT